MESHTRKSADEKKEILEKIFAEIVSSVFVGLMVILLFRILFRK